MEFVLAQIFGMIGATLTIIATQMKNKKKYLLSYIVSYVFFITSMIFLKAYSGAINSFILMILTIISTKFENRKFPIWLIFIFIIIILIGNVITYNNIFSLLPAMASYVYLTILLSKNMKNIRISNVGLRLLWMMYDFIVKAYTTFAVDIISVISALIAIYRFDIKNKKGEYDNKKTS